MLKFLDLSGVGNSGKSAVVDLLKEVETVYASDTHFEFDILRVPFGVLELRHSLVSNWSPIRSNQSIKNFRALIKMMGSNPAVYDIAGLIHSSSQRYDSRFENQFTKKFNNFCDSLIIGTYKATWPYDALYQHPALRFLNKILSRLKINPINEKEINLVSGLNFDEKFNELMVSLFKLKTTNNTVWATLNNAFEPYNPLPFFQMLNESKQIVILRDPRDIYVSGKNPKTTTSADKNLLTNYHSKTNFTFLASGDIEIFVKRYQLYRTNVMSGVNPRVLHIHFEDLCTHYDATRLKIFTFLNINESHHIAKMKFFNPENSAKNVGIWRKYSNKDEILFIEKSLPSYLYPLSDAAGTQSNA